MIFRVRGIQHETHFILTIRLVGISDVYDRHKVHQNTKETIWHNVSGKRTFFLMFNWQPNIQLTSVK